MKTKSNQKKIYRNLIEAKGLIQNRIIAKETDVLILTNKKLEISRIKSLIEKYRKDIEDYIVKDRRFLSALKPIPVSMDAPLIVKDMAKAAYAANVGPMTAVAGAIAEYVGRELLNFTDEVIVENGGDIFINTKKPRYINIYAGESVLSEKIILKINPKRTPLGICTSSGTVGHSLSFGKTDATVILAKSATLADAVATAVGNQINSKDDIDKAINLAKSIRGVLGVLVIIGSILSIWGDTEIIKK